jgi:hypothetical protein
VIVANSNGPTRTFAKGALLVLLGCVALVIAVRLLMEIWPWLLGGVLVIGLGYGALAWWRWRRSRW